MLYTFKRLLNLLIQEIAVLRGVINFGLEGNTVCVMETHGQEGEALTVRWFAS